jgi:5'-nucleotidase
MKNALSLVVVMLAGLLIGCAPAKKPVANGSGVLDVGPTRTGPVAVKSVTVEPLPSDRISFSHTPSAATAAKPVASTAAVNRALAVTSTPTTGSAYKIKRGDTLYAIAQTTYGDGKQWQKIAEHNPGLSPKALRVGQTITLP